MTRPKIPEEARADYESLTEEEIAEIVAGSTEPRIVEILE